MTTSALRFSRLGIIGGCVAAVLLGVTLSLPAAAQEGGVVGAWSFSSPPQQGGRGYAGMFMFYPNGRVQAGLAGGVSCVGNYQFDGETLMTQMSACQSCSAGFCMAAPEYAPYFSYSAPVQFQGQFAMTWLLQPQLVLHRN